jgi:hypothetical protein
VTMSPDPRTRRMSRWLLVTSEVALVLMCLGLALFGAVSTITCLNEGQSTVARVCKTPSLQSWYLAALGLAAVVALIGVGAGHVTHRWRNVFAAVGVSVVIIIATMAWGLHGVTPLVR